MIEISLEYQRLAKACSKVTPVAFFSNEHKKTREWLLLGKVQQLLLHAKMDAPALAEQSEAPDFYTYSKDRRPWAPIEVVEAFRPGYRRHHSYAEEMEEQSDDLIEPIPASLLWNPLREQIIAKAGKRYPVGSCLLAYFNIGRLYFGDVETPFDVQLLAAQAQIPFRGMDAFSRVLVLSADLHCLVQLHPNAAAVVSAREE